MNRSDLFLEARDVGLRYRIRNKLTLSPSRRASGRAAAGGRIEGAGRIRYVRALDGVSFRLESGDRLGLIGPNGAGKTTLLKVLYGIFPPTTGAVIGSGRIDALFNTRLGFRPEATGRRNIELRGLINGWTARQISDHMDEIVDFAEMEQFIDMPLKSYSQGMAARLAFAIATAIESDILLMDEWIGAGDKAFQEKATKRMKDLTSKAGIIVLASHNESLIERVCNRTISMEKGRIVACAGEAQTY